MLSSRLGVTAPSPGFYRHHGDDGQRPPTKPLSTRCGPVAQAAPERSPPDSASRRATLAAGVSGALAALLPPTGAARAAPAPRQQLQPLGSYQAQLEEAQAQLGEIGAQLRSMSMSADESAAEAPAPASRESYGRLQQDLHRGQLGRFWAIARAGDQYVEAAVPGERGSLAREEADLFSLLPERTGPLASLLKPNWDNPDDPLCLVYSCVNDPGAPPSINALYALKLLHVGLGIGAGGDSRVTPEGLLANVDDAAEKLSEYSALLAKAAARLPRELLREDGSLAGGAAPPASASAFGPSPLG